MGGDLGYSTTISRDMEILRSPADSARPIGLSIPPNDILIVVGGALPVEGKNMENCENGSRFLRQRDNLEEHGNSEGTSEFV